MGETPEVDLNSTDQSNNTIWVGRGEVQRGVHTEAWLATQRDLALTKMQELGIVTRQTDNNGVAFAVVENLTAFTDGIYREGKKIGVKDWVQSVAGNIHSDPQLGHKQTARTLYHVFKDVPVVTRSEYQNAQLRSEEPLPFKQLFYIPASPESALNPKAIAAARGTYHLGLWEVGKRPQWQSTYPTQSTEYDTELRLFDVAVAETVYGRGEGIRDDSGVITVVQPDGRRQPISGVWMKAHLDGPTAELKWDTPRNVMTSYGQRLSAIVRPEDFAVREGFNPFSETRKVGKNGDVTVEGMRFTLGNPFMGSTVGRLTDNSHGNVHLVYKQEEQGTFTPLLLFHAEVLDSKQNLIQAQKGSVITVPQGAFIRQFPHELGVVTTVEYTESGQRRIVQGPSIASELPNLVEYRQRLSEVINDKEMNGFSLEQQVALITVIKQYESTYPVWDFLRQTKGIGLRVLVDSYFHEGVEPKIFRLGNLDNGVIGGLMDGYIQGKLHAKKLGRAMQAKNEGVFSARDRQRNLFVTRILSAFEYRLRDLLVVAATQEERHGQVAIEQLTLMNNAMDVLTQAFSRPAGLSLDLHPNYDTQTRQLTSMTGIYSQPDNGTRTKITVRPNAVAGEKSKTAAQAGLRLSFEDENGQSISLRLDYDTYGISLDVGSRGSAVAELFERVGKSHHTQMGFDPGFQDPELFARFIREFGTRLGYTP
jgi:hypothetical protein